MDIREWDREGRGDDDDEEEGMNEVCSACSGLVVALRIGDLLREQGYRPRGDGRYPPVDLDADEFRCPSCEVNTGDGRECGECRDDRVDQRRDT